MSREKLCTWLNLPATPWPPDHYALLGLSTGQGSADEIEQRVLERMDKLRQHQLVHPDLVTEGMNLLAQALICLNDPEARREYERGPVAPDIPLDDEIDRDIPIVQTMEIPAAPPRPSRPTKVAELVDPPPENQIPYRLEALPDILLPSLVEEPLSLPDEDEIDDEPRAEKDSLPLLEPAELPPIRRIDLIREEHRKIYAEIVRFRRVLEVWERLRVYLDDPDKMFSRRTETVAFMVCLSDLRPLLPTVADAIGDTGQPGHLVGVLARQQLVVEMFRSLLPSQRDALAQDCRRAHYFLVERCKLLREDIRRRTAKNFARRVMRPAFRQVFHRPEWAFLALGVAALVVAFVRSVPR